MKRKDLIKMLKPYWERLQQAEAEFELIRDNLEREAWDATGIPIEFFKSDNEFVGIGDYNRKIPLIHDTELQK